MKNREMLSRMRFTFLFVALTLASVTFGCRKSQREIAEENAIKRHQQEVTPRPPPSPAQRAWMSNFMQSPEGIRTMSAGGFLMGRLTNGTLPGVSKNVNGYFRFEKKASDVTTDDGCSMEVHFLNLDQQHPLSYYFVITRSSSNSPWQFNKAWRTDQSSNVIEEYPVQ